MTGCNPSDLDPVSKGSVMLIDHGEQPHMIHFHELVHEQAAYSKEHLYNLHKQWFGPRGIFARVGEEIAQLGRQASVLDSVRELESSQRSQEAELVVDFALAQSNRRDAVLNPFTGRRREALCCVVFDETAGYTLVERYAAYEAIRQSDASFFIKLIATTRGVVERRIVFRGLLEHYDRLLPIEKSIYPDGYRAAQQAHLDREEQLYGPLALNEDVVTLLETISPVDLLERVQRPTDPVL
ncbi:hypothetical protein EC915_102545 [Pseudomonas sp. LP_7_YM]|nr:hypothetical protein EC915_102545 [Pseudomonas sp. LP_7_YM]